MANWYDTNKNGGHKANGRHEPGYGNSAYPDHEHHPMILDANRRKHDIIAYAEYQIAQSNITQTTQVVELRHGGGGFGSGVDYLIQRIKDATMHQGPGNKAHFVTWNTTPDLPENGHESPPKAHGQGGAGAVYHERSKGGSPRHNNGYNDNHNNINPRYDHNSPPPYSDHRDSFSNSEDDESDDEVCYNGVCYPNRKGRAKPNTQFKDDGDDRKPNSISYPAAPRTYGVPVSTQPAAGEDSYYGKPSKGNTTFSPPSYEPPYNRPFSSNPPPINTKPDHTKQPKFNGSPRKDKNYPEQQTSRGTIDCRTAAKKYHGVFVHGR